ncbi:MAG: hypothetical protein IT378_26755 [Sandaracinaceae bacterium]|nr:hypothetical protein [Sandaracinaceae bacterium]
MRAVLDAQTSSASVVTSLRAELARTEAGPVALALRRAIQILDAAEGVRTDDACVVLEIEKPGAVEGEDEAAESA